MVKMVLASGSAPRRMILEELGVCLTIIPSGVAEDVDSTWQPDGIVTNLARRKARAVADLLGRQGAVVIGCDTVVVLDGQVFGKPKDEADARSILIALRGLTHQIFSGIALIDCISNASRHGYSVASITMRSYSDDEIASYIGTGEGSVGAGAYTFQGRGRDLVDRYDGSIETIMGLPVDVLRQLLEGVGRSLDAFVRDS